MADSDQAPKVDNEVGWEWSFEQAWVGSYWIRNLRLSDSEWEWTVTSAEESAARITLKGSAPTREEARAQAVSAAEKLI